MGARRDRPEVTAAERARIRELHAAGLGCRAIARAVGRSPGSVSKVAAEEGLLFDTTRTAVGTECHRRDAEYKRVHREWLAWQRVDAAMRSRLPLETAPVDKILAETVAIGRLVDAAIRAGRRRQTGSTRWARSPLPSRNA